MPSFDVVNYSLRPNKSIQRSLVFEGVRILQDHLSLNNLVYVGLGSIWFTDFQMAHKFIRIRDMISIEESEIGFQRAKFNQPYKTVKVERGQTSEVLPKLFGNTSYSNRPWMVWLDYDKPLDEVKIADIRGVVENAPENSIVLATVPSIGAIYGRPSQRPQRLRTILGSVVPDDVPQEDCTDERFAETLMDYALQYMVSAAASSSRPGGFVPAFRIAYRDSKPMITFGGVLPSKGAVTAAKGAVSSSSWPAVAHEAIAISPLTLKEAATIQAALPRARRLTRKTIQRLGFDLDDECVKAFEKYYRYYPVFAQVVT
jgi:hypothetical protein